MIGRRSEIGSSKWRRTVVCGVGIGRDFFFFGGHVYKVEKHRAAKKGREKDRMSVEIAVPSNFMKSYCLFFFFFLFFSIIEMISQKKKESTLLFIIFEYLNTRTLYSKKTPSF